MESPGTEIRSAFGAKPALSRVLLIEDDLDFSQLIRMRFIREADAFEIECVETLSEGLERVAAGGIDVVLIDLGLKDSRGIGTFLKLHEAAPDIPTVILSGADQDGLAFEAIQRGAQDYLVKGRIDGRMLPRILRYAIERHEITRKLYSITEDLRLANTQLEKQALLDPLTELFNRRGLQQALSRELEMTRRGEDPPIALLVDLDDFKRVNDTLGHAVGDVVLKETARKLMDCLRVTDYLARIGGDEFMILLTHTKPAEALRIAERIRLSIAGEPISLSTGQLIRVSGSVGVITATAMTPSIDELLCRSHIMLHKSKIAGKNRVSAHLDGDEPTDSNMIFSGMHAEGLDGSCLRTVKQPIFNLSEGHEVGYELLSRCTLTGFEMPDDFFRYCMERNMLTLMDHCCLRSCLSASGALPRNLRRHVNLFPSTMIDVPTEHLLHTFSAERGSNSYCVEISEQQIIGDPSYLVPSVSALKRSGILIAIDDVGFGRSCVESLVLLEPDIIKIDKRFVFGIGRERSRRQALRRLLRVAEVLMAEVVAEGIENREDLEALRDLGVLYGQGYLLGRPV